MVVVIVSCCLLLMIRQCHSSSNAHTQISHLQDWTTIPKFELAFDQNPKPDDASQPLPLIDYSLSLESGTKYRCSIPDVGSIKEPSEGDPENEIMDNMDPKQIRLKIENNFEVLSRGKCVRKSEGFWVFEVCPFKEVRQIHADRDRELLAFSLGTFHRSSWDEQGNLVQEFRRGTDRRSSKAVFSCGLKQSDTESLLFVEASEPTPLTYLMKLETPSLCTRQQRSTTPYSMLYALNSKCIFLNKGWWSYEFCHLGFVRQFHSERVKAEPVEGESGVRFQTVTTASFILGRFPGNGSDAEFVSNNTKLVQPGDSSTQAYFSQTFSDGSDCDLTGKKRETEIRFVCQRNIDSAKFASVKEIKTCSYLVEIQVPTLCSHPKFSTNDHLTYKIHCTTEGNANTKDDAEAAMIQQESSHQVEDAVSTAEQGEERAQGQMEAAQQHMEAVQQALQLAQQQQQQQQHAENDQQQGPGHATEQQEDPTQLHGEQEQEEPAAQDGALIDRPTDPVQDQSGNPSHKPIDDSADKSKSTSDVNMKNEL